MCRAAGKGAMTEASMKKMGCAFTVLTVLAFGWSIVVWMAFAAGFIMYGSPDLLSKEQWTSVLLHTLIRAFVPLVVVLIAWLTFALAAKFSRRR